MTVKGLLSGTVKYWVILSALVVTIYWTGGFIVQTQYDLNSLRLRLINLEQRQTTLEDKLNKQNTEVINRLSRMEGILEEIRERK